MNENKINPLLDVMSEIDDNIITNTTSTAKKRKKRPLIIAAASVAATVTVFAGVTVTVARHKTNNQNNHYYYITEEGKVSHITDAEPLEKADYHSGFYIGDYDSVELPYKAPENMHIPFYEELIEMWEPIATSYLSENSYDVGMAVTPHEFAQTCNVPLLITDKFTEEEWVNVHTTIFDGEMHVADIGYALIHNDSGRRLYIRAYTFFNDNIGFAAGGIDPENGLYEKVKLNNGTEGVIYKRSKWDKRNCAAVFVHEGVIFSMMVDTEIDTGIDDMEQMLDDLGIF